MEPLVLNGFVGVDEFTNPTQLNQNVLSRLDNMVLDQVRNKPVKRGGIIQFNENTIPGLPINRGFKSLHDVIDKDGNNLVFGQAGTDFYKSVNGDSAWSSLKSDLTDNLRTRLAAYDKKFYVTNGVDNPFVTDGSEVWPFALERPNVQDVVIVPGVGGALDDSSTYTYRIVNVGKDGSLSEPSLPIWETTDSTNKRFTLTNLPTPTDSRVTEVRIYRTEGNAIQYWYLATIKISDTSYEDSAADTELDLANQLVNTVVPESVSYFCVHKNRLALASVTIRDNKFFPPFNLASLTPQTTGGSMADGTYRIKYSFLFTDGFESEGSDYLETTISGGSGLGSIIVTPRNVFNMSASAYNAEIESIRVYRTKAGETDTYYWVKDFSGSNTTITEDDSSLTDEFPKTVNDPIEHKNAVFISDLNSLSMLTYSNAFQIYPDDGDEITGIFDDEDGFLIFKKNSICKIFTGGTIENWEIKKLSENIGSDQDQTIVQVEDAYYFVYQGEVNTFRSPRGYFQSEDSLVKLISKERQKTFREVSKFYDAAYISKVNWYVLIIEINSKSFLMAYDMKLPSNVWYKFSTKSPENWHTVIEKKNGTDRGSIILSSYSEEILKYYVRTSLQDYGSIDYFQDDLGDLILDDKGDAAYAGDELMEIEPFLTTKTFSSLASIRSNKIILKYIKKENQSVDIKISDPSSGKYRHWGDSINSDNQDNSKLLKKYTDGLDGTLKRSERIEFSIYGAGLDAFDSLKLLYLPEDFGYNS